MVSLAPRAGDSMPDILARLRLPVIAAPMFLLSGIDMVVEACRSGVVGAFPAANARTASGLAEWLDLLSQRLADYPEAAPYAVNINVHPQRYSDFPAMVEVCREARVPLVITSVGNPSEMVSAVHDWGGLVFHDVTTVRHAEKAAQAGVDGLILVCAGAGGHAGATSAFSMLPRVRQFFDKTIVLAGGIATGRGILAATALGADLVYMGTRFIASAESLASAEYKQLIVDADLNEVLYTECISGLPANFLRSSIRNNGLDPDHLPTLLQAGKAQLPPGIKAWKHIWSAGHAVALVDSVASVKSIVEMLIQEYAAAVAAMQIPTRAALPPFRNRGA
jgi:nitronate monooxygenase